MWHYGLLDTYMYVLVCVYMGVGVYVYKGQGLCEWADILCIDADWKRLGEMNEYVKRRWSDKAEKICQRPTQFEKVTILTSSWVCSGQSLVMFLYLALCLVPFWEIS